MTEHIAGMTIELDKLIEEKTADLEAHKILRKNLQAICPHQKEGIDLMVSQGKTHGGELYKCRVCGKEEWR